MPLPDHQITNDAGKVTIYLLHGIYGAKEYWRFQTKRLIDRGYRVIAWEAPGYGLSPLPENFSFDAVAEAGAQLIRATASERNVVFGHSMGGQITPRIVSKVRDRVQAAVITATIGYFGNRTKEEQEEFIRKRSTPPPPGTDPAVAQLMVVNSMLGPTSTGPEVELVRSVAAATPPKTVQAAVKAVQAYPEAELNGVLQIPVNEKKGLTFARGLRSILRHDPDKIMVGEIRDAETAQIAVQSALTGHLV